MDTSGIVTGYSGFGATAVNVSALFCATHIALAHYIFPYFCSLNTLSHCSWKSGFYFHSVSVIISTQFSFLHLHNMYVFIFSRFHFVLLNCVNKDINYFHLTTIDSVYRRSIYSYIHMYSCSLNFPTHTRICSSVSTQTLERARRSRVMQLATNISILIVVVVLNICATQQQQQHQHL